MSELVLGIDIGTGSTKGVLARPDGSIVATAVRAHEISLPRPGWAEMDAETIWWDDVVAVSRQLCAGTDVSRVRAVCISGVGPCLLPADAADTPLRPAILYGIDTRAEVEIAELTELLGAERVLQRGGSALSSQAVGPKMLWLRRHEPQLWRRTRRWYNPSSFAGLRLCGEYTLDHHTASQSDPLYAIAEQDWAHDWAELIAPDVELPRLVWPGEVIGTVTAQAAEQTGLRAGTAVCAGTVDAWSEAFSVGVRRPGDLMMMYGSTAFLIHVMAELRTDPVLWTTTGVERGTYSFAAGTATSGALTNWIRALTGDVSFATVLQEAAAVAPGSDGLLVLPYFQGERTPIFDPRARGVIAGLSLRHGRGHLYRAGYEGIAFGLRHILEHFDVAGGGAAQRMVAVGGGTSGGLWTQIVSDVTGREQHVPEQAIGASYGDALLAAVGAELVPADTDWARPGRTIEPDVSVRDRYDELYAAFRELYPATRELMHSLAAIQDSASPLPTAPSTVPGRVD